jgi:hypothetical protein
MRSVRSANAALYIHSTEIRNYDPVRVIYCAWLHQTQRPVVHNCNEHGIHRPVPSVLVMEAHQILAGVENWP